jgi:hypothetical protein
MYALIDSGPKHLPRRPEHSFKARLRFRNRAKSHGIYHFISVVRRYQHHLSTGPGQTDTLLVKDTNVELGMN